jgi:phenylalanyl-tRNA synthetase beta chain
MAMKISLNWLKDYIDYKSDIETIIDRLTFLGFEIEKCEKIERAYNKIVVGKVLSKEKHPEAEKLSVTQVDVGGDEPLQIVCGAPNVDEGQTVPVATKGAVLGDLKIKNSKLRGIKSMGMICSESELEISENHDGIMVLDDSYKAGTPLKELFGYEDYVLEADITPNRPDMFGYFGFGREFTIFDSGSFSKPEFKINNESGDVNDHIKVEVEDSEGCPRYCSRVIKNVKVGPSPKWLQERLTAIGLRPINNVVDITNFVMMETGHPMHAFDAAQLAGSKIVVKRGFNQNFTTLDGEESKIHEDILMICDAEKPVAIAGVMGGENSGVTEMTKDVVLEVAYFNFVDIRHATRDLNLSTDSARRFERGVDPNDSIYVIDRAAALIEEICEGDVMKGVVDHYPNPLTPKKISLRTTRTNKVLGFQISNEEIKSSLEAIECSCKEIESGVFEVEVPTYRPDITDEIDLIEEVVRVYGYEKIPESTRTEFDLDLVENSDDRFNEGIKGDLIKLGLYEICSRTMQEGRYNKPFGKDWVELEHPLNEELNSLRTNVLSSLIQCCSRNLRYRNDKVAIFESGAIFEKIDEKIVEKESCGVIISGKRTLQKWNDSEAEFDFYDIKGYLESFADLRGIEQFNYAPNQNFDYFDKEESLLAVKDDKIFALFGRVSDDITQLFEIDGDIYGIEFFNEQLKEIESLNTLTLKPVSKFPKVQKDLSVLLDLGVTYEEVEAVIKKYGGKKLRSVTAVDYYQGDKVEDGKKSYTYRMVFQSDDATLKDKEIEKMFNKVINGVKRDLNVEIR